VGHHLVPLLKQGHRLLALQGQLGAGTRLSNAPREGPASEVILEELGADVGHNANRFLWIPGTLSQTKIQSPLKCMKSFHQNKSSFLCPYDPGASWLPSNPGYLTLRLAAHYYENKFNYQYFNRVTSQSESKRYKMCGQ
jgi:hypothetical protein